MRNGMQMALRRQVRRGGLFVMICLSLLSVHAARVCDLRHPRRTRELFVHRGIEAETPEPMLFKEASLRLPPGKYISPEGEGIEGHFSKWRFITERSLILITATWRLSKNVA